MSLEGNIGANPCYPVCIDLRQRRCVVIGGRSFIVRRIEGLLEAGAEVTVISPDPCKVLDQMAQAGRITLLKRHYRSGDLAGAFLALNTSRDQAQLISEDAKTHHVLVNNISLSDSDFTIPSVLRQGGLSIAISTSGIFPALAVRIRERLASSFGPEYARFLELVEPLRRTLPQSIPDYERRRRVWYELVDSDVLDLLSQGDEDAACALIQSIVQNHVSES